MDVPYHPCSGTPMYWNPHITIVGRVISQLATSGHRCSDRSEDSDSTETQYSRVPGIVSMEDFAWARPPAKNVHNIRRCYQGFPGIWPFPEQTIIPESNLHRWKVSQPETSELLYIVVTCYDYLLGALLMPCQELTRECGSFLFSVRTWLQSYPLVNVNVYNYGKSPCFMGKLTISIGPFSMSQTVI